MCKSSATLVQVALRCCGIPILEFSKTWLNRAMADLALMLSVICCKHEVGVADLQGSLLTNIAVIAKLTLYF